MSTPITERDAWVALASVDGVGEGLLARFIRRFGSAAETVALAASSNPDHARRELRETGGRYLDDQTVDRILAVAADPGATERRLAELGAWVVTPLDPDYPRRLRDLDPPPVTLFGMGARVAVSDPRSVAVVGTRHPTPTGRALASAIARRLTEAGATVISGLAVGIDGAAHAATVEAGGTTVAVIGGGFDHPGPRAHERLRAAILAGGGAIVSEHPPATRPSRGTFPRRNRIISALARATIVVEAPARSGALITARHALEQGRRLLVVPGRPGDATTEGCLGLLRETPARPLVGLDEMLVDLGLDGADPPTAAASLTREDALALLGPVEGRVARVLLHGPVTADRVIAETRLSPSVVASALTLLQLRGWAQPLGALHLPAGPLLQAPAKRPTRTGVVR